jgi:hypothetical protein
MNLNIRPGDRIRHNTTYGTVIAINEQDYLIRLDGATATVILSLDDLSPPF